MAGIPDLDPFTAARRSAARNKVIDPAAQPPEPTITPAPEQVSNSTFTLRPLTKQTGETRTQITVRIESTNYKRLKKFTNNHGVSMQSVLDAALDEYFKNHKG